MIGQDRYQLFLVLRLEEVFQRSVGEFGERFIRRRKYGERTRALECVDKPGGLDRRDECLERPGADAVWTISAALSAAFAADMASAIATAPAAMIFMGFIL